MNRVDVRTSAVLIDERGHYRRARSLSTSAVSIDERGPHRLMRSDEARRPVFRKIGIYALMSITREREWYPGIFAYEMIL